MGAPFPASRKNEVWLFWKNGREGDLTSYSGDHTVVCPLPNCDSHRRASARSHVHAHTYTQRDHMHTQHSVCNSVFLPKISL